MSAEKIPADVRDRTVTFTDKRGRSIALVVKGATSDKSAETAARNLLEDGAEGFEVTVE